MDVASLGADEFVHAFAQHGRSLWVLAAAWVGRSQAADLVQEVALVAWRRRSTFTAGTNLRGWLAQIVRHVGANWRRRHHPEPRAPEDLPEPCSATAPAAAPVFDADGLGLSDEMARALASVPPAGRACLLLQVVMGLSFAEIAEMLGIPENTAMSHARRARLTMRLALESQDLESIPAPEMP